MLDAHTQQKIVSINMRLAQAFGWKEVGAVMAVSPDDQNPYVEGKSPLSRFPNYFQDDFLIEEMLKRDIKPNRELTRFTFVDHFVERARIEYEEFPTRALAFKALIAEAIIYKLKKG